MRAPLPQAVEHLAWALQAVAAVVVAAELVQAAAAVEAAAEQVEAAAVAHSIPKPHRLVENRTTERPVPYGRVGIDE